VKEEYHFELEPIDCEVEMARVAENEEEEGRNISININC